ncbi:MAG: hypothetical protein JXR97_00390 [Planctomycetes bacterium]|nr:hypothetical protein [Planctomycetota bacterium]
MTRALIFAAIILVVAVVVAVSIKGKAESPAEKSPPAPSAPAPASVTAPPSVEKQLIGHWRPTDESALTADHVYIQADGKFILTTEDGEKAEATWSLEDGNIFVLLSDNIDELNGLQMEITDISADQIRLEAVRNRYFSILNLIDDKEGYDSK